MDYLITDGPMTNDLVQWLQNWSELTLLSSAAVASIFFVGSFILFPRTVLCLAVGALFGCAVIPVVLLSTTAGGIIAFLFARHLFAGALQRALDRRPRLRMVADAVDSEGWRAVALLRFWSPVPTVIQNYVFGLTRIGVWPFTWATFFFSTPQIAVYIFLGASGRTVLLQDSSSTLNRVLMAVAMLSIVAIVALIVRRMRKGLGYPGWVGHARN
jgi:uncharacterized membrane protein YdjX (TVP38/TMEM64 family)